MSGNEEVKKDRGFHHDGYNYGVKNPEKTRYGCIKTGCRAKLYINKNHDQDSIRLSEEPHTCEKSTHQTPGKKELRRLCQQKAAASVAGSTPKSIFTETCLENRSIATAATFPSLQKTIQRSQRKSGVNPGIKKAYSSIRVFGEHLQQFPELLTYKLNDEEVSISANLIQSSSQSEHLIIYDKNLMEKFDQQNDMYTDSTFNIVPDVKGVKQFLTIMCKKYNTVVPCAWVLMSRRTTTAYDSIWKFIKETFPNFRPQRAMGDFEKAQIKSLRNSFPNITVRGCYFHFCQAIVRKAKSKEYQLFLKKDNKDKNPNGHEIIKKILVLPLLPQEKVREGVDIIKNVIDLNFANDAKTLKKWKKFISYYFEREWMKIVTPKGFSVYNMVDRTNNYLESYHRTLNQLLRTKPSTYTLFFAVIKIKEESIQNLERARKKMKTTVGPKERTRLRDETIRNAWLELQSNPPWTVEKFINELSGYDDDSLFELIDITEQYSTNDELMEQIDDSDDEDDDIDFEDFNYLSSDEEVLVEEKENEVDQEEEKEECTEKTVQKKRKRREAKEQKQVKSKKETKKNISIPEDMPGKRVRKPRVDKDFDYS